MAFQMTVQGQSTVLNAFGPVTVPGLIPPLQLADLGAAGATGAAGGTGFTTARTATAIFSLAFPCTKFQVVIFLKKFVVGSAVAITGAGAPALALVSFGPVFSLEAADNVGMTANLITVGETVQAVNLAGDATVTPQTGQVQCFRIQGVTPVAGKQFIRLIVDPTLQTGAIAGIFDAVVMAEP